MKVFTTTLLKGIHSITFNEPGFYYLTINEYEYIPMIIK